MKNGECFRVDALISEKLQKMIKSKSRSEKSLKEIQEILSKLDSYSAEELGEIITKYDIKSPLSKNKLSAPMDFNLMFECSLGPEGKNSGFLRPETAQVMFKKLFELIFLSNLILIDDLILNEFFRIPIFSQYEKVARFFL